MNKTRDTNTGNIFHLRTEHVSSIAEKALIRHDILIKLRWSDQRKRHTV